MKEIYLKVYIILLNYNGWVDTIECLENVLRIDYPNYQVIVVDNNSPNNSMEYIKAWAEGKLDVWVNPNNPLRKLSFPPVQKPIPYVFYSKEEAERGGNPEIEKQFINPMIFIQTGYNGGFAFGNNVAIKYALAKKDAECVLLLNNDTVVEKDFLNKLVEVSQADKKIGITGCKIYYYDNPSKIWFNGGKFNEWTGRAVHIQKEINKEVSECNFITGCCMLIKREVLEKVGLLDESYFMYVEDLDYSYKTIKSGYKLAVAHNSIIWHKVGASGEGEISEFSAYWIMRSRIRFVIENFHIAKKISALSFITFTRLIKFIEYLIKGRKDIIFAQLKGIKDAKR
ncbi:glycosyltransferase family 2 protein [Sulfurihydrogenibium azorense]|uniref:glycosyltransferase family 2 protein n=1 Tax=Sulfurihydrogenibium azorense TaxID=309806 RepID=UPI003919B065